MAADSTGPEGLTVDSPQVLSVFEAEISDEENISPPAETPVSDEETPVESEPESEQGEEQETESTDKAEEKSEEAEEQPASADLDPNQLIPVTIDGKEEKVTLDELEVPNAPRRAQVYWAEFEVPDVGAGRRPTGWRRILYDPEGAEKAASEGIPDRREIPEARPLPEPIAPPAPRDTRVDPIRLPPRREKVDVFIVADDEDELDFILNVVLDLD